MDGTFEKKSYEAIELIQLIQPNKSFRNASGKAFPVAMYLLATDPAIVEIINKKVIHTCTIT